MNTMTQVSTAFVAVALAVTVPTIALGDDDEEKISLADCPAAVQKTIKENAGDDRIVEVERETKKDGTVVYEAEVKRADGSEMEIEVAADGKLIKIEIEDDDDADDDDAKAK